MTKSKDSIDYAAIAKMPKKERAKLAMGISKELYKTQLKASAVSTLSIGAGAAVIYGAKNKYFAKAGEFLYSKAKPIINKIKPQIKDAIKTIRKATPAQKGLGIVAAGIFLVGATIANIVTAKSKAKITQAVENLKTQQQ